MKHPQFLLLALASVVSLPAGLGAQTPASGDLAAQTDVYHVQFVKAAAGEAAALAKVVSTPEPGSAMPGHLVVLRHQLGDDWDYCVIEHLGTKTTVEPTPAAVYPGRNLTAWHGDTFVSGPPWAVFEKAMGLTAGSSGAVYSVAVWRSAPGHRDQLEKSLMQNEPTAKVQVGRLILRHLEGGAWHFLAIDRYNSWQDLATDQAASAPATGSGPDGWSEVRRHSTFHHDTLADRIAPK